MAGCESRSDNLRFEAEGPPYYLDCGEVTYESVNGHPPRLPDLGKLEMKDSFSFDRPDESPLGFGIQNEFLLRTPKGKYALIRIDLGMGIKWVYQPDGSRDIDRRRKTRGNHCTNCR